MTSPSAPYFGIVIQSPILTISLALTCRLATKPKMESLKININIADPAPRPAITVVVSCPVRIENSIINPIM